MANDPTAQATTAPYDTLIRLMTDFIAPPRASPIKGSGSSSKSAMSVSGMSQTSLGDSQTPLIEDVFAAPTSPSVLPQPATEEKESVDTD